jgi:DNA/RNA-binding domain of Phe-tRNA-synthetase-like protein
LRVDVAASLRAIVAPVLLLFDGVTVLDRDDRLDAPLAELSLRLGTGSAEGTARPPSPTVDAVRVMYRRLGIDPTKTRPSSEALLRRLKKGEGLPRINTLVDICNWCSVETQLPFGLYDRAHIAGEVVTLRRGLEGEGYHGIRKDHVNVGGRLTLVDAVGPFVNPTSDSARTMVTGGTSAALFVIYAPVGLPAGTLARAGDLTAERTAAFAGGRLLARFEA